MNGTFSTPLLDNRIALVCTSCNTRTERLNQLLNFRTTTVLYGTKNIESRAVQAWNDVHIDNHYLKLQDLNKSVCKKKLDSYE